MRRGILLALFTAFILLMYAVPYTALRSAEPLVLYVYWTLIALAAYFTALLELRRWA